MEVQCYSNGAGSNISKICHCILDRELGQLVGQKGRRKFKEQYRCEVDPQKRDWQEFIDEQLGFPDKPCVFADISTLYKGKCQCFSPHCIAKDGSQFVECGVQTGCMLSATGFSCKNFSALFSGEGGKSREEILSNLFALLSSGDTSSGKTYRGMMGSTARERPLFKMWENVMQVDQKLNQNETKVVSLIQDEFNIIGYVMSYKTFNANDGQLPGNKFRIYAVCMDVEQSGLAWVDAQQVVTKILADVRVFLWVW